MNRMCFNNVVILCVGLSAVGAFFIPVPHATKVVVEGNSLQLACNTTKRRDVESFFWVRNVTTGGNGTSERLQEHSWRIELAHISRRAAGTYICHAVLNSTEDNVTLSVTDVDVQYPAEVESMSLSPRKMFANQTFSVNCSLRANPGPVWSIYNNVTGETVMTGRGSMLSFHASGTFRIANQSEHGADVSIMNLPVTCGDSGFWVCTGYNELSHGINTTRAFPLTVVCPPQPKPFFPSDHVYKYKARVGDVITMSLNVTSDPAPMFWWSRGDGSAVHHPFHFVETSTGTSLTLRNVSVDDFGTYTLQIFNIHGYFWAHFDLQAHGAPGNPHDVQVSNIADTSVDLSWVSGYDMGSHQRFFIVKWIKNEFIQISDIIEGPYTAGGEGKVWRYHQTGLDTDAGYKLAVFARNDDSFSFSDPVVFNTTSIPVANAAERSPLYIRAIIGGSVGLGVVSIVMFAIFARAAIKDRKSSKLIGKQRLLQNIQSQYGGTLTDDFKKQRLSGDVISHKPQPSLTEDENYINRI